MTILITGGSKCGKSRFAESLMADYSGTKIYLATMQPFGKEAHKIIASHRKMRADKGFLTVECQTQLHTISLPPKAAVLLEDIGNLVANEMFGQEEITDCTETVLRGIRHLQNVSPLLILVSNQVCSDGITYGEGTAAYIRTIGNVNRQIAAQADQVYECVYGIPICLKGESV